MTKPFYITTPLYYVNAKPHIGHAYTNILSDTFARWRRLQGEDVFFMTGTDEHGTKIDKAAREQGKAPKAYADEMVPEFKKLWELLGIQYDYFIRTTDAGHKKAVQTILCDLEQKGDIYRGSYTGWYCTPCESFWTSSQLNVGAGLVPALEERPQGAPLQNKRLCPDCKRDVQELSEENYFFKLSKYQKWLIEYIDANPEFIKPEIRKNEILGFLRAPLEDLCITRPRTRLAWGIDYPGSKDHVVYVWFDALINYVSGAGFTVNPENFSRLWPADVHVVGKDILRHHAVYWPIMLKALGLQVPKTVLAHGWWTMSGAKVSKSRGNAVDPIELVKKYGVDSFRYFLLREVTVGLDGAFSEDLLAERYTSDLANDLGNLWFRLAVMLEKYFEGKIPNAGARLITPLLTETYGLWDKVDSAMSAYDPRNALAAIWAVLTLANQFVEEKKPWALAKEAAEKEELASVLVVLAECLAHVSVLLLAFLPQTASEILRRLHVAANPVIPNASEFARPLVKAGTAVEKGAALFPRLDENAIR